MWECISKCIPDSKVHGANLGPTWVLSVPDGPQVGPMNLAIRDSMCGHWFLIMILMWDILYVTCFVAILALPRMPICYVCIQYITFASHKSLRKSCVVITYLSLSHNDMNQMLRSHRLNKWQPIYVYTTLHDHHTPKILSQYEKSTTVNVLIKNLIYFQTWFKHRSVIRSEFFKQSITPSQHRGDSLRSSAEALKLIFRIYS